MTKDTIRQLGVIIATIGIIAGYAFTFIMPVNGVAKSVIADKLNVYFVPASYAFSIWIVIYLGLIAYSIYQALPSQKENQSLRKIGWWHIGGCLALSVWTFFWNNHLYLFMMFSMIGLLVILLSIYDRLNIGFGNESRGMRFLVHFPFSIFLGWITMATIANISQFLYSTGWNGFGIGPKIWAVVLMVFAIVIAELTAFNRQDLVYLSVIVWSFIGIAVKQIGVSPVFEAACVAAGFVIIMAVITLLVKPKIKKQA